MLVTWRDTNDIVPVFTTELKSKEQLPASADAYLPFRNINGGEEAQLNFFVMFDEMIECVTGKKRWTRRAKVGGLITASQLVTSTDEAFAILCLENYWDKWMTTSSKIDTSDTDSEDGKGGRSTKRRPVALTKWTDARRGHIQFGGWNDEGLSRFNTLCVQCRESRQDTVTCQLAEEAFLEYAIVKYGKDGDKGRMASRNPLLNRDFVSVLDDFDDEVVIGDGNTTVVPEQVGSRVVQI